MLNYNCTKLYDNKKLDKSKFKLNLFNYMLYIYL